MTLKSIIQVDVDDSQFVEFTKKFQQFQQQSSFSLTPSMPSGGVVGPAPPSHPSNTGVGGTPIGLANIHNVLEEIKHLIEKLVSGSSGGGHDTGGSTTGGGILSSVPSILRGAVGKMALGLAGGAAAVVGLGALAMKSKEHLDRISDDATAIRSASRSANVSVGAYRAFKTDLAPYGDGESLLQRVTAAQSDIRDPAAIALRAAGISPGDSSDKGAIAVLKALRQVGLDTKGNQSLLGVTLQQRNLDGFDGGGDLSRQMGSISQGEFDSLIKRLQDNSKRFDVKDDTTRVWQDLNTTVAESRAAMATAFIKDLPYAARLETEATKKLVDAMESASNLIQSKAPGLTGDVATNSDLTNIGVDTSHVPGSGMLSNAWKNIKYFMYKSHDASRYQNLHQPGMVSLSPEMQKFEWSNIANALGQTENSRMDPGLVSKAGAIGLWQVMPKTAQAFGYSASDMTDPYKNADASSRLYNTLLKKYNDPIKALAAYNEGETKLDKQIKEYGDGWKEHLKTIPKHETYDYITSSPVAKEIQRIYTGGNPNLRRDDVTISNRTQNDVFISTRNASR